VNKGEKMRRLDSKGITLVELCVSLVVLALTAQATVQFWKVFTIKTVSLEDKSYAGMKAQQMLNELLAQSSSNPGNGTAILDSYNDGSQYNLMLTIDKHVSDPGNPLSGNRQANGHWHYLRQVQVSPVATDPLARQVLIHIWKCASDGNPLVPGLILANINEMIIPSANISYSMAFSNSTPPSNPQTYPYSGLPSSQ
jgi:type II secretory pathway pseudopilin PulG